MSEVDHIEYFRGRAAAERELARTAPELYIASIHSEMADRYEALCNHPHDRNVLWIVAETQRRGLAR